MSTYAYYLSKLNDNLKNTYICTEAHDYHNEMVLKHHNGKFDRESNIISAVETSSVLEATNFKYRIRFNNCDGRNLNKWIPKNFKLMTESSSTGPRYYLKFYRLIGYEPFTFEDRYVILGEKIQSKIKGNTHIITDVWENNVLIAGTQISFQELFDNFLFFDKSPCGKMYLIEDYAKEFGECYSKPVFPENTNLKENENPEKQESWRNCIIDNFIETLKSMKV